MWIGKLKAKHAGSLYEPLVLSVIRLYVEGHLQISPVGITHAHASREPERDQFREAGRLTKFL